MKKVMYVILLLEELIVDVLLLSLVWTNMGRLPCVAFAAVWIGLVVRQVLQLKKNDDEAMTTKIKRRIALAMLVPFSAPVVMILWLVFTLF